MGWQDAPEVASASGWQNAPEVESAGKPSELSRQAGLGARGVAQGVGGLANMPLDFITHLANLGKSFFKQDPYYATQADGTKLLIDPNQPFKTNSQRFDEDLTSIGLPQPGNASERVANLGIQGMTGAAGVTSAASRLPGALAQTMAARPALQAVSGATGGMSAGIARENGAGPWGQLGAGFLGGMIPSFLAPRPPLLQPQQTKASAEASAKVSPGAAGSEAAISVAPEARMTGGGINYGSVGADDSAGLTRPQARLMKVGKEMGMKLTPGQATGSRALQQLEAKLESQPMTSGPFNTIKADNAKVLNRAWAKAIGEKDNIVDAAVLDRADQRISDVYKDIADDVQRPIDPKNFIGFIGKLQDDTRGLVSNVSGHPLIEDVTKFAVNGKASGKQLQSLASKLGKAAYKNMSTPNGDRDLGIALYDVKDYVDDLLAQGLSTERATTFSKARKEYRNLMLLTQRQGNINASGNVNGRSLAATLQTKDKKGYLYGRNQSDEYEAARFAQAFAPIVGDSGTASRSPIQGMTDLIMRMPMNVATRAYTSSPAVELALKAQAMGQTAQGLPPRYLAPLGAEDMPTAGMFPLPFLTQKKKDEERK